MTATAGSFCSAQNSWYGGEAGNLWTLTIVILSDCAYKIRLRCQVLKTLELPTSHQIALIVSSFLSKDDRQLKHMWLWRWWLKAAIDGTNYVLWYGCRFLKCLPEEQCFCAKFILDINFLDIMICLSSKTNSISLRDLSPLISGQDQESGIYCDLEHPPGSRNLNLSAFSSRYDGRCTAEADFGTGPIFLISSWKLYSSGNMSNRSSPSQMIFWILEWSKKLDRRTRSAWLYAIILNTNSSIVLKQKLQCQPASASIRSVCLECRYRVPGWNMCAVARQLL